MPEPLREFLQAELPEAPVELEEGERISEAVVLFRVVDLEHTDGHGLGEYYRYTVTTGVNLAMAFGMLEIATTTLMDYYQDLLREEDDDA